jgi:hypothetical protein
MVEEGLMGVPMIVGRVDDVTRAEVGVISVVLVLVLVLDVVDVFVVLGV